MKISSCKDNKKISNFQKNVKKFPFFPIILFFHYYFCIFVSKHSVFSAKADTLTLKCITHSPGKRSDTLGYTPPKPAPLIDRLHTYCRLNADLMQTLRKIRLHTACKNYRKSN